MNLGELSTELQKVVLEASCEIFSQIAFRAGASENLLVSDTVIQLTRG